MPQHETKYCPRCNDSFECKVGDIAHCQCNCVQLAEETIVFLSKTQYDCLCKNCLNQINAMVENATFFNFPNKKEDFIEGIHYYIEKGYWVFTELYHYLRGNCCGNNCRHCPYGNASQKIEKII